MAVFYLVSFVLGAGIGSFLNVVAQRSLTGESFVRGRSHCPRCGATLGPLELVPVLSWLLLRGRCRHCAAPISPRYPFTEGICGGLFLLCFWWYGLSFRLLIAWILAALLFCISLMDLDAMTIPNGLVLALLVPIALELWRTGFSGLGERLLGFGIISLPMLGLTLLIPDCFGGGDIKLMALCGFFLGWKAALLAAFLGIVSCGAVAGTLLLSKKVGRTDHIAFGPYLAAGVFCAHLFSQPILLWYFRLIGV